MPLVRLNDQAFERDLAGVRFGMTDQNGNNVPCLVTDAALQDRGGLQSSEGVIDVFLDNRDEIENLASALFDNDPSVKITIDTRIMNPDQFS